MPVTPASLLAQVADFGVGSMAVGRFGAFRCALPFSAFQFSLPLAGDLRKSGSLYLRIRSIQGTGCVTHGSSALRGTYLPAPSAPKQCVTARSAPRRCLPCECVPGSLMCPQRETRVTGKGDEAHVVLVWRRHVGHPIPTRAVDRHRLRARAAHNCPLYDMTSSLLCN